MTSWLPGGTFLIWVFIIALRHINDFDYWTHLALGRNYADGWERFLHMPTLLFSESTNEWPFQVMIYGLESIGSHSLVSIATAGIATLVFVPLVWRANMGLDATKRFLLLLFLVWIVTVMRFRFTPRPELLAYLLFSLGLWLVFSLIEAPSKTKIFALLTVLLIWFPLHPTLFIGGPLLLAVAIIMPGRKWWLRIWLTQKPWLLWVALPLSAILLYGTGRFALRIYSYLASGGVLVEVTEMRPTWEFPDLFWMYLVGVFLATGLSIVVKEGRRRRFLLVLIAFLPGLIVVRNVPLSMIFMAFVAIEGAREWSIPPQGQIGTHRFAILYVFILIGSGIILGRLPSQSWGIGVQWEYFPRQAAEYVAEQHLPAPIFNNWDCGGYLNWRWQGRPEPFLDGRQGSKEIMAAHDQILEGDDYADILDRLSIKTILLQPFYQNSGRLLPVVRLLLADRRWVLVDASDALVFVRAADSNGRPPLSVNAGWQLVLLHADRIGRIEPDKPHLEFTRGIALFAMGRIVDARSAFQQGFKQSPELTDYYRAFKSL